MPRKSENPQQSHLTPAFHGRTYGYGRPQEERKIDDEVGLRRENIYLCFLRKKDEI